IAGAVMFARAAIPRMVTLSTPTSPTMDLAAFRIRNRVRSLMLRSLHCAPDKPLRREGDQERPAPLADHFGEQRSLLRRGPGEQSPPRPSEPAAAEGGGERCSPEQREKVNVVHQNGRRRGRTFMGPCCGGGQFTRFRTCQAMSLWKSVHSPFFRHSAALRKGTFEAASMTCVPGPASEYCCCNGARGSPFSHFARTSRARRSASGS